MNCNHKKVTLVEGKWFCAAKTCNVEFVMWTTAAGWRRAERETERRKIEDAWNRLSMLHSETLLALNEANERIRTLTSFTYTMKSRWRRIVDAVLGRDK